MSNSSGHSIALVRAVSMFLSGLLIATLCGCGSNDPSGMQSVTGTVKFSDGQPVTGEMARVVFLPDRSFPDPPTKSASGVIEADGSFSLMTNQPGDGAAPGHYKVVLEVWANYREQRSGVPDKYSSTTTTPFSVEVRSDNKEFDFSVDR